MEEQLQENPRNESEHLEENQADGDSQPLTNGHAQVDEGKEDGNHGAEEPIENGVEDSEQTEHVVHKGYFAVVYYIHTYVQYCLFMVTFGLTCL